MASIWRATTPDSCTLGLAQVNDRPASVRYAEHRPVAARIPNIRALRYASRAVNGVTPRITCCQAEALRLQWVTLENAQVVIDQTVLVRWVVVVVILEVPVEVGRGIEVDRGTVVGRVKIWRVVSIGSIGRKGDQSRRRLSRDMLSIHREVAMVVDEDGAQCVGKWGGRESHSG